MLSLCRWLLRLYPPEHRLEYGEEMMRVLSDIEAHVQNKGVRAGAASTVHEVAGLLYGAIREHLRAITGSRANLAIYGRRVTMRSEFRFPKAAVVLMTIILVAILVVIEQAKSIQASIPYANPHVGPIKEVGINVFPLLLLVLLGACAAATIGWAVVFALHRSGTHRFSRVDPSHTRPAAD